MAQRSDTNDCLNRVVSWIVYAASIAFAISIVVLIFHRVNPMEEEFDDDFLAAHSRSSGTADTGPHYTEVQAFPWTGKRVLKHFELNSLAQLLFSPPVTTEDALEAALQSGAHVIEIPVMHSPENEPHIGPVIGWDPPGWRTWHLTLKRAMEVWVAAKTNKGIMFTFLDPRIPKQVLAPVEVYQRFGKLTGPVFIGAELIAGPGRKRPAMAQVMVPTHVSVAFRQATPELRLQGFHPHTSLMAAESTLDFSPALFLKEAQLALPGAFLVAKWTVNIPCPKGYLPPPTHLGRRLLVKGHKAPKPDMVAYTMQHMTNMQRLIEESLWSGGVALSAEICQIGVAKQLWQSILQNHNSKIPGEATPERDAAAPWQLESWVLIMQGVLTEAAGKTMRETFSPHALMLNVSDPHGHHIMVG
mmetsp:Transcript_2163/g.6400  ORF Transcript_2163/g.6400 Transcript_2163/m.6400 type:complete len:415 (-) Transcript_2163:1680-2924(-)